MALPRLNLHGKRVLVVDDVADDREMLKVVLGFHGLTVDLAGDGEEALELVARSKPDLVFCDLMMPRLDGFAFLERMKSVPEYARIPVIAISGLGTDADIMRTWREGFDGHLVKPIDFDLITAQLERVFWISPRQPRSRPERDRR